MKSLFILCSIIYIIFNVETGRIEESTNSVKIDGRNIYTDNTSFMETSLQVGTTTQYIKDVTINTNQLTDVKIVTFQTLKPIELKTLENNFLLICSNFTGNVTQKMSFAEIYTQLKELKKNNREMYETVRDDLIFLDAYGKRFNKDWWDTCVWHPEIVQ